MRSVQPWAVVMLMNCGGGQASPDLDGTRDPDPVTVTIKGSPGHAVIAFRHEDDPAWQVLSGSSNSQYEVEARGAYRVVFVCASQPSIRRATLSAHARTPDDPRTVEASCGATPPYRVTGTVTQPDIWVAFNNRSRSGMSADWRFEIPASQSVYDLAVVRGERFHADEIAVHRDIAVSGDLDLGVINAAQENLLPMDHRTFAIQNALPEEFLHSSVVLELRGTLVFWDSPGDAAEGVPLAPPAVLRSTDRQWVSVSAFSELRGQRYRRTIERVVSAELSQIALPPPMGAIGFTRTPTSIAAMWSSLPPHTQIVLELTSYGNVQESGVFLTYTLTASRAFVEAVSLTRLALELGDLPGLRTEWRHLPSSYQYQSLLVQALGSDPVFSSMVDEQHEPIF